MASPTARRSRVSLSASSASTLTSSGFSAWRREERQQLLVQALAPPGGGVGGLDHPVAPARVARMALDHVERADDNGEQVVEVVRHAAGELAHGLQLLGAPQRRLGLVAFGERGLHPLGQEVVDALPGRPAPGGPR